MSADESFTIRRAPTAPDSEAGALHANRVQDPARAQALEALLNTLAVPMVLVGAQGAVLFTNEAAARLIALRDGLVADADCLRATLPVDTRALHALIDEATQGGAPAHTGRGGMVRISRAHGRRPLEVLVSPLPVRHPRQPGEQPPIAALFITEPQPGTMTEERVLAKLYGLTASQAKVVIAICNGLCGKEICRELDISYNTLKTHLRHVYAKTRTRHQSDLIRLLAWRGAFGWSM